MGRAHKERSGVDPGRASRFAFLRMSPGAAHGEQFGVTAALMPWGMVTSSK